MKIGLALSGGGAKGIAHAGAVKALLEYNVEVSQIAGSSAGALIGALFAAGVDIEEIYDFFKKSNMFSPNNFAFKQPGFIKSNVFIERISSFIPNNSFELLEIPLTLIATDLNNATLKVFKTGELYLPILASAAFPGVFTPVEIEGKTYVDGGVVNNFPADLLDDCDYKIGSYVNKVEVLNKKMKYSYDVVTRSYSINQYYKDSLKFHEVDLLFNPDGLHAFGLFSFKYLRQIFDIGYEHACKQIECSQLFK